MYSVFLGLGSNIGEREKFLSLAVQKLKDVRESTIVWSSSVYETDPVGNPDQPKFLNAVVEVETALKPRELLAETQMIEHAIGRTASQKWGPRQIDIDILLYDGVVHEDDTLSVPHEQLAKRKFVLVPFREIAPDVVHPVNGMTIEELAECCQDTSRVVRTSHKIII